MITIELLFAANNSIWQQHLSLPEGTTAAQALAKSTLYKEYPETQAMPYGVFGELCAADTRLYEGDRLEVYRPLVFDPMESRRRRVKHKAQQVKPPKRTKNPM